MDDKNNKIPSHTQEVYVCFTNFEKCTQVLECRQTLMLQKYSTDVLIVSLSAWKPAMQGNST